jgi:hypothetical protein
MLEQDDFKDEAQKATVVRIIRDLQKQLDDMDKVKAD